MKKGYESHRFTSTTETRAQKGWVSHRTRSSPRVVSSRFTAPSTFSKPAHICTVRMKGRPQGMTSRVR